MEIKYDKTKQKREQFAQEMFEALRQDFDEEDISITETSTFKLVRIEITKEICHTKVIIAELNFDASDQYKSIVLYNAGYFNYFKDFGERYNFTVLDVKDPNFIPSKEVMQ